MAIDRKQVREFVQRWQGRGYEKGDTQQFWLQALRMIGYAHPDDVLFEHHLPSGGYIDVWIRDADVLVEQKALGIDLDKPEPRQGQLKTPLVQALDYVEDLPRLEQPRFLVTCNFDTFRVYDRDRYSKSELAAHAFEFKLAELAEHPEYLGFIVDPDNSRLEKEKRVSIQAGELIGQLYDRLRAGYLDPDSPESMHALNVLCVRLVFCLYCEDAGLFAKDAFYRYLKAVPAAGVRMALKRLFKALDTEVPDRDPYDLEVREFPYVNGGLFRSETEVPNFSEEMKEFLLEEVSATVDWSQISPTIFGGIFESTLNPQTRRSGGMHYTSPENIHKVIDPLFLDDLRAEFRRLRDEEGVSERKRKNQLRAFHRRLCALKFFDPACGSGNFLTETYLSLRKLEDAVLAILNAGQTGISFAGELAEERVSLSQFYGIEINDFAVTVAETALWISRLKANGETFMFYEGGGDDFPLRERATIVHGNALRVDWREVVSPRECAFIMGNPPFIGQYTKQAEQTADMKLVWGPDYDGYLDYVTAWYRKAADFWAAGERGEFAFVSTNSIAQGQPVPALFGPLLRDGWRVKFAYQTFPWDSEAVEKAAVHCVIVGFCRRGAEGPGGLKLFTYLSQSGETVCAAVSNINPYLIDGPDVLVRKRSKPLSKQLPAVYFGSKPTDSGYLIVETEAYDEVMADEIAAKYVRPFRMGKELIRGLERWCLWLEEASPEEIYASAVLRERVRRVREFRLASKKAATQKKASTPHLFDENHQPNTPYLAIPRVFSENRFWATCDHYSENIIAGDKVYTCEDPDGFAFGVISSSMFITWQKAVGGRLKSDCNFSNTVVWNNFPLPEVSAELRAQIIAAGQGVLRARAQYPSLSLAELYAPELVPPALLEAHRELDALVDRAFGASQPLASNEERLPILIRHYLQLTAESALPLPAPLALP